MKLIKILDLYINYFLEKNKKMQNENITNSDITNAQIKISNTCNLTVY